MTTRTHRDPQAMLSATLSEWGGQSDLWLFGYASLIWRPEFEYAERRPARIHGWHRSLKMWSRVNRGTPEIPGLVFALLSGGSCQGVVFRVAQENAHQMFPALWEREMVNAVYDPRWIACKTPQGVVKALAFTLSRRSPNFTGHLSPQQYRQIFESAQGRYGSTLDYARTTANVLAKQGIDDKSLRSILRNAL